LPSEVAIRTDNGGLVCAHCRVADRPLARMKGLLGRDGLGEDEGLLIRPGNSVHTAFMRFPIDVVFLDRDVAVLRVVPGLHPWRAASCRRARSVLELPAGACTRTGLRAGDRLRLEP